MSRRQQIVVSVAIGTAATAFLSIVAPGSYWPMAGGAVVTFIMRALLDG
ncbi:MAG: hypothetical protein JO316_11335 [Abitibacteriaceae bacterium]|nr:hypothetical protein [Abditibacteriaceae bacterium]